MTSIIPFDDSGPQSEIDLLKFGLQSEINILIFGLQSEKNLPMFGLQSSRERTGVHPRVDFSPDTGGLAS